MACDMDYIYNEFLFLWKIKFASHVPRRLSHIATRITEK